MKAARLCLSALFAACALAISCNTHEDALAAAKADLQRQVTLREQVVAEADDVDEFEDALDEWLLKARSEDEVPLLPVPRISLKPIKLSPLAIPELPPPGALESTGSTRLRDDIAALIERARALDRRVSEMEVQRSRAAHTYAYAIQADEALSHTAKGGRVQTADSIWTFDSGIPVFQWDAGIPLPPPLRPDAGQMRRIDR